MKRVLKPNPNLYKEGLLYQVNHHGCCWLLKTMRRAKLITEAEQIESKAFTKKYLISVDRWANVAPYPIKHMKLSSSYAYLVGGSDKTLWDKRTDYGRTRRNLFKAIIENINKQRSIASEKSITS